MKRATAGFGLLELLVALLLFTLGVLGWMSSQVLARQHSLEALQASQATALARDMLARMHSNSTALQGYVVSHHAPSVDLEPASGPCQAVDAGLLYAPRCTAAQLAAHDLAQWFAAVAGWAEIATLEGRAEPVAGLLQPSVCIEAAASSVTVAIAWRGVTAQAAPPVSACGAGLGRYGADDRRRRVVELRSWVPVSGSAS